MSKSPRLKYHVHTIDIDPYAVYEHKCLENIKEVYKQAVNCDNQQQFKDILKSGMVYTPERFTNNSPISPMTSTTFKKSSA